MKSKQGASFASDPGYIRPLMEIRRVFAARRRAADPAEGTASRAYGMDLASATAQVTAR